MTDLTCFGCRGSHAVSGKDFTLFGGHTTSFLLSSDSSDTVFLIDAGSGICNVSLPDSVKKAVLLFTHTHLDHITGFPFFPALHRPDFNLTVCGPVANHGAGIKEIMTTLFAPAFFPVNWDEFPASVSFSDLHDGDCCFFDNTVISCFRLPHPSATLGYRLQQGNRTAVFCFDAELEALNPQQREKFGQFIEGVDLFTVDATYTAEQYINGHTGFGHTAAETAAAFAERFGVRKTGLTHHSPKATDTELFIREKALKEKYPTAGIFFFREGMNLSLD